jgi:arabinogalactan endo-1,4-beta-galactosidase
VANPSKTSSFYKTLINNGVTDFDIIGFTYYYAYHGQSPEEVGRYVQSLKNTYSDYDVMVVETGYLWDTENIDGLGNIITGSSPDYQPVTASNQQKFLVDLTKAVQNAGGTGVIFWEPAWVSTSCTTPWGTGSSQEHVAFFDHRNGLNFMKKGGGGWPDAVMNGTEDTIVNVTFKVDMSEADTTNGVYLVGQVTSWDFVKMKSEGGGIFSTSFKLIPGDIYAYYYITNNSWTDYNNYRETVPDECADSDELLNDTEWTTDRAFVVPNNDTIIENTWSSCEPITDLLTATKYDDNVSIYPNPSVNKEIVIENKTANPILSVKVCNLIGQLQPIENYVIGARGSIVVDLSKVDGGIYFVNMEMGKEIITRKIVLN